MLCKHNELFYFSPRYSPCSMNSMHSTRQATTKVMIGSTSDVNICFSYQSKGSDAGTQYYWLFCWATYPSCLVKKMLVKRPSHACLETLISLVKVNMVYRTKKDDNGFWVITSSYNDFFYLWCVHLNACIHIS